MAKRGRRPKPWNADVLADIERMKGYPLLDGWPFGLKMTAGAAGRIGRILCNTYNEQRLPLPDNAGNEPRPKGYRDWHNGASVFSYLFEGLTLLTESYGIPRWERTGAHAFWLDPERDEQGKPIPGTVRASGQFNVLWGTSIPGIVLGALTPPRDGSPLVLSPFGLRLVQDAFEGGDAPREKYDSYVELVSAVDGDIDGALKRITQDVGIAARSKADMYLAGNGPDRNAKGRRIPPLVYVGRNEVSEARAIVRIAAITTATAIKWLQGLGLSRADADAKWSYIIDGMVHSALIEFYDEHKNKEGAFGRKLRKEHGEEAAEAFAGRAAVGEALLARWSDAAAAASTSRGVHAAALEELMHGVFKPLPAQATAMLTTDQVVTVSQARSKAGFVALCLFGVYLLARFKAHGLYYPKWGTVRLCRCATCQNPAFMWAPKKTATGHRTGIYKADPPNYCKRCETLKDADRQQRYRDGVERR